MDKVGLELSVLARFVVACQAPRLSDAARQLGQTPAALSIAMRKLEERLGMKLFQRERGGLSLLPSAFWLFRKACQLLDLETHIRQARGNTGRPLVRLTVDLNLSFAMGRVSGALIRTTQQMARSHPELLIDWHFMGLEGDDPADRAPDSRIASSSERVGRVRVFYQESIDPVASVIHLHDDPWVIIGAPGGAARAAGEGGTLSLLHMRPELIDAVTAHARVNGWAARLQFLDQEPAQISDVLHKAPHLRLLLPSSLLPIRMGAARHDDLPLSPAFTAAFYASCDAGKSDYVEAFFAAMRQNLARDDSVAYAPQLTTRQIHYFNLAVHSGSISAAARVANVAQSSVSSHVSQMEAILGGPLLVRHDDGISPSVLGSSIAALTADIEARQDWIVRKARDIAAHAEARVTIGTLPSSGHDSVLTEKIAHVVTRIHSRHPDWQLQIVESSNTRLHERVRAGELNLAIVGVVSSQVARIGLGPSEPLSVIAHPSISFGGRSTLGLEEVCALPLVLGPRHLSIHQSVADAAQQRSLRLHSVIEVGSLPLAIAMVRQAPLCTVLPASSVRQDIEAGNLVAIPINQHELSGALSIIFSAERALSDAERTIVQECLRVFRPGRENVEPVDISGAYLPH
ncbi:MAG: LysR substrate-binding domain-containing protein [Devosia sp.]